MPSQRATTPAGWKGFRVVQDDPEEPASGLCCVASAGIHLGTLVDDDQATLRIMERLPDHVEHDGMGEQTLRALARAAGLGFYRPNVRSEGVEIFEEQVERALHVALLKMAFVPPKRRSSAVERFQYVLVLEVTRKGLVVADPHPWHPSISVIPTAEFIEMWSAPRGVLRPRWVGMVGAG